MAGDYNGVEVVIREAKHDSVGQVPVDTETHEALKAVLRERLYEEAGRVDARVSTVRYPTAIVNLGSDWAMKDLQANPSVGKTGGMARDSSTSWAAYLHQRFGNVGDGCKSSHAAFPKSFGEGVSALFPNKYSMRLLNSGIWS